MIKVIVEMWPGGFEEHKYPLASAEIWNTGELNDKNGGSYEYRLNLKRKRGWFTGRIDRFNRGRLNVWFLIQRALDDLVTNSSHV